MRRVVLVALVGVLFGLRHPPPRWLVVRVATNVWGLMPERFWPGEERRDLDALHPAFRARLERVLARLEAEGHPAVVHRTWRSPERQRFYRLTGWSKLDYGYHTVVDGRGGPEALAADVAPVGLTTDAARAVFWRALLTAARAEGLTTGATWTRSGRWRAAYPDIGWDPGHVQLAGTSLARVRDGWRP
jgi:hypothetical protein